jgi:hypothetical protein
MADQSFATQVEKAALSKIEFQYRESLRELVAAYRRYGGERGAALASLREEYATKSNQNVLSLYEGKTSWGDYNRLRKQLYEDGSAAANRLAGR